ncbi:MAG: MCE family protein [Phycisphaerales bacterium]|nr:MCE family protein [Phycisphaerales bacterium]MCB9837389.1 MCE family protein [Phycisphaera sp.]
MARHNRSKASLMAGSLLIFGLVGFIVISAIISGSIERLTPTQSYTVRFNLQQGTGGLTEGASVLMGGQPVGRVTKINFALNEGVPEGVDVGVRVRSSHTLYRDAMFVLERPLVGLGASLNIVDAGTAQAGVLEPGSIVIANLALPAFLTAAGFGAEQVEQLKDTLANTADIVERADVITSRLETDLDVLMTDFKAFSSELAQLKAGEVRANADAMIDDFRGLIEESRELLRVNRPRIDDTLSAAQRTMAKFEGEHSQVALDAIERAGEAAENLADLADEAADLLTQEKPGVLRTLANARLASDQLRLATIEIRRNPWKLLARPDTKELREELFYDAARVYATAASDLQDAGASLEAILAKPGGADEDEIRALTEELKSAMARYKQAEAGLLEAMFE